MYSHELCAHFCSTACPCHVSCKIPSQLRYILFYCCLVVISTTSHHQCHRSLLAAAGVACRDKAGSDTVTATHQYTTKSQVLSCRHRAPSCRGIGLVLSTAAAHQACTLCANCSAAGQGCQEPCRLSQRSTAFEHALLLTKRTLLCFQPAHIS